MSDNNIINGCFITGTDTGVGKTIICLALLEAFKRRGLRVAGMKPVASGCEKTAQGPRNEDALKILGKSTPGIDYRTVNPFALALPAAPILAARHERLNITAEPILSAYNELTINSDLLLVEGVGGWRIQLNDHLQMADIVKLLNLPVIMVVGLRLGCINHAILTAEAIRNDGCRLIGWISNQIAPDYDDPEATAVLITKSINVPMLAGVPYLPQAKEEDVVPSMDRINIAGLRIRAD